jgi:hypothetical protein
MGQKNVMFRTVLDREVKVCTEVSMERTEHGKKQCERHDDGGRVAIARRQPAMKSWNFWFD